MAKENKLFGESCSWEGEKKLVKDRYEYYKSTRSIGLPVSRQFPVLGWRERPRVCRVEDRRSLPMGYPL
jgi:hypothetical protein